VITIGLSISEALGFLHEKGLVHRDIKPSNIIFVDGKAKLADIGLVASRGQRTFVGTEGFVPPEGPGTAQSDVYALGKVLYEMATGRDRLDFPELPDELPEVGHKKRWQALNQLICDVCEPRFAKRDIKTADRLADGLRRLQAGRRLRRRRTSFLLSIIPVALILGLFIWFAKGAVQSRWASLFQADVTTTNIPAALEYGFVKVLSNPAGAEVYHVDGEFLDVTPLRNIKMKAGSTYSFEFRLDGYRTGKATGVVTGGKTSILDHKLVVYSPPVEGQNWVDHDGVAYLPHEGHHISKDYIGKHRWLKYLRITKIKGGSPIIDTEINGNQNFIALVTEAEANQYAKWLSDFVRAKGYLNDVQSIYAVVDRETNTSHIDPNLKATKRYPFRTVVKKIPFARLEIHSTPVGASVLIDDVFIGNTPVYRNRMKPGKVDVTLIYEGYRKETRTLDIAERSSEKLNFNMKRNSSVVFGEDWKNSLGMKFVPIDDKGELLVSIWETRISDFKVYGDQSRAKKTFNIKQGLDHPVLGVSRKQAEAFCKNLTEFEREKELIPSDSSYRLLSDSEWSLMSGVVDDSDKEPAEREFDSLDIFPWGGVWPPNESKFLVGNLAGEELNDERFEHIYKVIKAHDDGYRQSSPVGSFTPNSLGIYDLAGNAYEWVSDNYSEGDAYGVLRGGSYDTYLKEHLYVGHRNVVKPSKRGYNFGFRVALEKTKKTRPALVGPKTK